MKLKQAICIPAAAFLIFTACKKEKESPVDPLLSSLRAYYKFDNNFNDSTGVQGTGVADDKGVSFGADRNSDPTGAVYFNGVSGSVSFNDVNIETQELTVSVWIRPSPNTLVYFVRSNDGGFGFFQNSPDFGFSINLPATNSAKQSQALGWMNLIGTYDGKIIKLYINGELVSATVHPGKMPGISSMTMGSSNQKFWKGFVDDLRIYDRVLTDGEIKILAQW